MKPSPRLGLWPMLPLLYMINLNAATPLSSSSSLGHTPQPDTRTPTASNPSISNFAVSPTWNGTLLPSSACITTTLFALASLALQNFTSTTNATTWSDPTFSNLALSLSPPPHTPQISIQYAIWGLSSALNTMLTTTNHFETASFILSYKHVEVGSINYTTTEYVPQPVTAGQVNAAAAPIATTGNPESPSEQGSASEPNTTTYTLPNPTSGTASNASTPPQVQIALSLTPVVINQTLYFTAIMDAMVALAPSSAATRLSNWNVISPYPDSNTNTTQQLEISFLAVARSSPPFLVNGDVIRVLGALPGILLDGGVERGVDMDVLVDGVLVGRGAVGLV